MRLPVKVDTDAAWHAAPPDPLDDPDLYDGVVWRRVAAYLLDVMAIAILGFLTWLVLGTLTVLSFGLLLPVKVVALVLLPVAYHTVFTGRNGATPGMQFFDLEVRTWIGTRPDYVQAFLMTVLFYTTTALTAWLVLVVALFNDRRRTLHDFMAGTVVVRHTRVLLTGLHQAA